MNTELALRTIEALEPYARRLVEKAEQRGDAYEAQWFLALQQARMVLAAFDGDPNNGLHADRTSGPDNSGDLSSTRPAGEPNR
jgi:hypothetical protein